ncbi:MAG: dihydropteroate synthase [Nitrospiraceae bacterium]|nr:dihydropteroate synthase [Nitrospiraceae bacterium]
MIVIADNLNTRNKAYMSALDGRDEKYLRSMAGKLASAHADVINVQCSLDGAGDEERLPWAIEVIEKAAGDLVISIDSRNLEAVRKSLSVVRKPPLINYMSETEPVDRGELFSIVQRAKAYLVLRASRGTVPTSFEAKLQILEGLLEEANRSDIPNERLFLDPSIIHLGRGAGQDHIVNSHECLLAIREMVDPPASTIAWISNISSGLPRKTKKAAETSLLIYLAGAGLDAAMVDVLDPGIQKALYFIKSFRDEIVFSPSELTA